MAVTASNYGPNNNIRPHNLASDQADETSKAALEAIRSCADMTANEFNERPYQDKFWNHENFRSWPIFAIEAHKQSLISIFQVATIIFQYAVVDQFANKTRCYNARFERNRVPHTLEPHHRIKIPPKWIHLDDSGFDAILTKSIELGQGIERLETDQDIKEAVEYIKKSLKNKPLSEQYLFMIDGVFPMENYSTLLDFYNEYPFSFSGSFFLDNKLKFAIPSFSIIQAFLEFLRPKSPILLDPVIGNPSSDASKTQEDNKVIIDLQMPLESRFIFVNGMFAGKAGFLINNAIRQPLNLSSHSSNDNKVIAHLRDLLELYIQISEALFEGNLELFFAKYKIESFSKKKYLKNKLNWGDSYINWLIAEVLKSLGDSECLLKLDMSDFDLTEFEPEARTAKWGLANLKKIKFRICLAKKFRGLLDNRFIERFNEKTLLESLSSDPFFKALFILNPGIYNLIIKDQSKC